METQFKNTAEYSIKHELVVHMNRLWRYGFVLSRNRDIAEELVQEPACVLWRSKSSLEQEQGLIAGCFLSFIQSG